MVGIVELLVIPIIGAALQVLFAKIASREFLQLFKKRGLKLEQLADLRSLLFAISAVLTKAEDEEITNLPVKWWVEEVKDAVYEAEDVLDEIVTGKRQEAYNSTFNKKLEDVIARLRSVAEQKDVLGFKGPKGRTSSRLLPTTSLLSESEVFGRNNDETTILKFLLPDLRNGDKEIINGNDNPTNGDLIPQENHKEVSLNANELKSEHNGNGAVDSYETGVHQANEIPVVAIVGMPGVGKTTLAQLLFNNAEVIDRFNLRVWIHISEEFNVLNITKGIYECVSSISVQSQIADLNNLQVRMKEALKGKKILLVLDDFWNENFDHFDAFLRPFKYAASGSRIILTSRNSNVASTVSADFAHHLTCLSDEDCWSLFVTHGCRKSRIDDSEHPEIKERILQKCRGLPLAAKTLGSLLYSKPDIDDWNEVLKSQIWDILPSNKCNILPILQLSYTHLPSHLKHCFAYCSIFPKGYMLEKSHLVSLWMAEGLVTPMRHGYKRREEMGNEWFNELFSRSFFQQFGSYYVMHDLFSDLARHVSGEFCFNYEDGSIHDMNEKVRRFSFLTESYDIAADSTFRSFFHGGNRLRTFLPLKSHSSSQKVCVLNPSTLENLLKSFDHLRVLSLSPYQFAQLHDSIGNLRYLRYLDLSHSLITTLPPSVCSLYNLETLLLLGCRQLIELPKDVKELINLQHLNIKRTKINKMPLEFGKLKKLQVLTDFVMGDNGSSISELKELYDLGGTLSLLNLDKVDDGAGANLKEKKYLTELNFVWTNGINHNVEIEEKVLDGLEPHMNLKRLTISNYGGNMFHKWLGNASFSKMVYLHLVGCENCLSLPSLGQLSSLKELHVANMKQVTTVGSEFCYDASSSMEPFKSLEILKFEDMPMWSAFMIEHTLPRLQNLHLHKCPILTEKLPEHLPSLNTLYISKCPNLKLEFPTDLQYKKLYNLELKHSCNTLESFPLDYFTRLEKLQIQGCYLKLLEHSLPALTHLQNLRIDNCPNLEFPDTSELHTPNLKLLIFSNCSSLKSLPSQIHSLTSLQTLTISNCIELAAFPKGGLPANLQSLSIKNCNDQLTPKLEWGLGKMAKLNCFEIEGKHTGIVSFPQVGLLPKDLDSLIICGFQNLESLNHLGFQQLTHLRALDIYACAKLDCISDQQLPSTIHCLNIIDCGLMEQRCRRGGADWDMIRHISKITIDGEEICA